jgi:hypothetical protein
MKKRLTKYVAETQGVPLTSIQTTKGGQLDLMDDLDGVLAAARKSKVEDIAPSDLQLLDEALEEAQLQFGGFGGKQGSSAML